MFKKSFYINLKQKNFIVLLLLFLIILCFLLSSCSSPANEYEISFDVLGNNYAVRSTLDGKIVDYPIIPIRSGFIFDGWYSDQGYNEKINSDKVFTADSLLYAKWRPSGNVPAGDKFIVTFNANGGNSIQSIQVEKNKSFTLPIEPTSEGKIFEGWFVENETFQTRFNTSYVVTSNITVYAKWIDMPVETIFRYSGNKILGLTAQGSNISEIIVPKQIGTNIISEIAINAFRNSVKLKKVTISTGVTLIGQYAFEGCSILSEISIPQSVTEIQKGAFKNCTELLSVQLPTSITQIPDELFYQCSSLQITGLRNGIVSVGAKSYYGCQNIKNLILPPGLSAIGPQAFAYCKSIQSVNLIPSVKTIGNEAFKKCEKIKTLTISDGVEIIGDYAFLDCFNFIPYQGLELIPNGVIIPASATLGKGVFKNCRGITDITLTNGLSTIPQECFYGMSYLTDIFIPDSVNCIDSSAFSYCIRLIVMSIPHSVTNLPKYIFDNCTRLEEVEIYSSLTEMGVGLFRNCVSLKTVTFFDTSNLQTIGKGGFENCYKLENLDISNSIITVFDENIFLKCEKLTTLGNAEGEGHMIMLESIEKIGKSAFSGSGIIELKLNKNINLIESNAFSECYFLQNITVDYENTVFSAQDGVLYKNLDLILYPAGKKDLSFSPDFEIQNISDDAFKGNKFLENVDFGAVIGMQKIGKRSFHSTNISSIIISNSTKIIEEEAFYNAKSLTNIFIPFTIERIASRAFGYTGLKLVEIPISVVYMGDMVFNMCDTQLVINIEAVETPDTWSPSWDNRNQSVKFTQVFYGQ